MGLDQYAFSRNKNSKLNGTVTETDWNNIKYEWRKHARLQVFMRDLFNKRTEENNNVTQGAFDLGFNGDLLEITKEDIEKLKEAQKERYWNYFCSDGFFWGQQFQEESCKEYAKQDKAFINWAMEEIEKGNKGFYTCSW